MAWRSIEQLAAMLRHRVIATCVVLAALASAGVAAAQSDPGEPLAVVVSPGVRTTSITLRELRAIYRGEQQFWDGAGGRITLLLPPSGSPERDAALRQVFRMTESEFTRFWIAKTFRDEVTTGPKVIATSELTLRLVRSLPGAIALVRLSDIDPRQVRVLRVDGRQPGEDGYPLRAGPVVHRMPE
jgi:ABC-type phosphate transport system substrate-binding protein